MNREEFKNLYNSLIVQNKEKDIFLTDITIQNTKFTFFKNENKNYLCKFSFDFLQQPQQVEVQLLGKNELIFKIDDTNDVEQEYDLKEFKQYFNSQYLLFKEAFTKFKEFLLNKNKLKKENNTLKIIPFNNLIRDKTNDQTVITIDGIDFTINKIQDTFKDTYRIDFELDQSEYINEEKYATAIFKILSKQNFFIMNFYLNKQQDNLQDATSLDKEDFVQNYPTYFESLNRAIKTFSNMND